MSKSIDITNHKFNRLTAVSFIGMQNNRSLWRCLCECGNIKDVFLSDLRCQKVKSCGCLRKDTIKKLRTSHGLSGNHAQGYGLWVKMKQRCINPLCDDYKDYGGRGIKVYESWIQSFESFINDVGPRPSKHHSIERIDNDGNYEPSNVRWATHLEQSYNRRSSKLLIYNGYTKAMAEWCVLLDLNYYKVRYYVGKGLPLDQIINNHLG